MSTHRQIFYHIIFGTKHREHTLAEDHCRELYNYIFRFTEEKACRLYRINGTEDHLCTFFPTCILLYRFRITSKALSVQQFVDEGNRPFS